MWFATAAEHRAVAQVLGTEVVVRMRVATMTGGDERSPYARGIDTGYDMATYQLAREAAHHARQAERLVGASEAA